LGNFLTKIGYIIKYKSGAFFCEVEIGKTAESEYGIIGVKIIGQQSARELIKGIPDHYWR
jgi:hypothetical protein